MDPNSLEVYFKREKNFTNNAIKIYDTLEIGNSHTCEDLAKICKMDITSVRPRITELIKKGVVVKVGSVKNKNNNSVGAFTKLSMNNYKPVSKVNLNSIKTKLSLCNDKELQEIEEYIVQLRFNKK